MREDEVTFAYINALCAFNLVDAQAYIDMIIPFLNLDGWR